MLESEMKFKLTQEDLESLEASIRDKQAAFITSTLQEANSADISSLLNELDVDEAHYAISLLEKEVGVEQLADMDRVSQERLFKVYSSEEASSLVDLMDSDDAVDILNELPVLNREEIIAQLKNEERADHIIDLLRYDDDTAGGLMAKE